MCEGWKQAWSVVLVLVGGCWPGKKVVILVEGKTPFIMHLVGIWDTGLYNGWGNGSVDNIAILKNVLTIVGIE